MNEDCGWTMVVGGGEAMARGLDGIWSSSVLNSGSLAQDPKNDVTLKGVSLRFQLLFEKPTS